MEIKKFYKCPHCGQELEQVNTELYEDRVYDSFVCECGWKGYKVYELSYVASYEGSLEDSEL